MEVVVLRTLDSVHHQEVQRLLLTPIAAPVVLGNPLFLGCVHETVVSIIGLKSSLFLFGDNVVEKARRVNMLRLD